MGFPVRWSPLRVSLESFSRGVNWGVRTSNSHTPIAEVDSNRCSKIEKGTSEPELAAR